MTPRGVLALRALAFAVALIAANPVSAVPLTPEEVVRLCNDAEDKSHCGRLIEQVQLKRLPGLAKRDGLDLVIGLYPSGTRRFSDVDRLIDPLSFSLYDSIDPINAVLLYKVEGDRASFVLLQRATNRVTELPSEPVLAPNRQRLATADFCATDCTNELVVWRVAREGVVRELVHRPPERWTNVTTKWKDAETVVVDYTPLSGGSARTIERKLSQPDWQSPR